MINLIRRLANLLVLVLVPIAILAQSNPTRFESNLTWTQIKDKAKKENKFIFVDCVTTWCGPCKEMAINVFPKSNVGAFLNKNFVNVRLQFDTTKNDSPEVKRWYTVVAQISKKYAITAYPSLLIFSPDGEMVQKIVGGGEAEVFIGFVSRALNPETQYAALYKKYKEGDRSSKTLKSLAEAVNLANETELANKIAEVLSNAR